MASKERKILGTPRGGTRPTSGAISRTRRRPGGRKTNPGLGPIVSWDVRMDPSAINGMLPQAPPIPWLHPNSGLVSFSELLLQLGMSSENTFVGPVAVPEPGVLALIGLGAAVVLYRRARR